EGGADRAELNRGRSRDRTRTNMGEQFREDRLHEAHELFLAYVRARDKQGLAFEDLRRPFSGHPFFRDSEVDYKRKARADALALLPPPGSWHAWLGEPGRILR